MLRNNSCWARDLFHVIQSVIRENIGNAKHDKIGHQRSILFSRDVFEMVYWRKGCGVEFGFVEMVLCIQNG